MTMITIESREDIELLLEFYRQFDLSDMFKETETAAAINDDEYATKKDVDFAFYRFKELAVSTIKKEEKKFVTKDEVIEMIEKLFEIKVKQVDVEIDVEGDSE